MNAECQAEARGIARIVEVSGMVGPLWALCECQVEFGNVLQRSVKQICCFVLCIIN